MTVMSHKINKIRLAGERMYVEATDTVFVTKRDSRSRRCAVYIAPKGCLRLASPPRKLSPHALPYSLELCCFNAHILPSHSCTPVWWNIEFNSCCSLPNSEAIYFQKQSSDAFPWITRRSMCFDVVLPPELTFTLLQLILTVISWLPVSGMDSQLHNVVHFLSVLQYSLPV